MLQEIHKTALTSNNPSSNIYFYDFAQSQSQFDKKNIWINKNVQATVVLGNSPKCFGSMKSEEIEILETHSKKLSHFKDFCYLRKKELL